MQVALINQAEGGSLELSDSVFGAGFNESLVHQIVTAYMAGGRAGTKAQKNRAAVRGGGRKPWRQKGTGRARAGTIRSPLWRGGGRTFAASPRDYTQKVNAKMYRGALRSILSELVRQGRLKAVESVDITQPKTKELVAWLSQRGLQGALILVETADDNLALAARNLPFVQVCEADTVDPVSLVAFDTVVATAAALRRLEGRLQ
jgi:large subunit ribosomal protein L4